MKVLEYSFCMFLDFFLFIFFKLSEYTLSLYCSNICLLYYKLLVCQCRKSALQFEDQSLMFILLPSNYCNGFCLDRVSLYTSSGSVFSFSEWLDFHECNNSINNYSVFSFTKWTTFVSTLFRYYFPRDRAWQTDRQTDKQMDRYWELLIWIMILTRK